MNAEEIFKKEHDLKNNHQEQPKETSVISPPVDEKILSVEGKLEKAQAKATEWQRMLIQNETIVSVICFISGVIYSFAVNECTGDYDFPWYAVFFAALSASLFYLLLIREGSLQLVILVKFASYFFLGHILLMFLVAIDSHSWKLFTVYTCKYPFTSDFFMGTALGAMGGFLGTKLSWKRQ